MSKVLKIREMTLGAGKPKICIPITGKNETITGGSIRCKDSLL